MKKFALSVIFIACCCFFCSCANGETKSVSSNSDVTTSTTTASRYFEIITATGSNDGTDNSTATESAETDNVDVSSQSTTTTSPTHSSASSKTVNKTTTTVKKDTTPTTTTKFVPVVDSFFNDALFVGDSVSLKLKLYCLKQNNNGKYPLGHATFFAGGSFSWNNSLWDPSRSDAVHPMINGKKMKIADAVVATNSKKVFIMLGVNDIGVYGPDGAYSAAQKVTKEIRQKSPDTKIYIQSATPIYPGCERGSISNSNIQKLNEKLKKLCKDNGYIYLDIWSQMGGETLLREYCSDPDGMGIHFTDKACKKWISYLNNQVNVEPEVFTTVATTTTKKPATTTKTTTKVTTTTVVTTTPITVTTTISTTEPEFTTPNITTTADTSVTAPISSTEASVSSDDITTSADETVTSVSITTSEGDNL